MSEEQPDTQEMRVAQSRREAEEKALAGAAGEEPETATHRRRAEKAQYLREKLEERAESEREASGEREGSDDDEGPGEREASGEREAPGEEAARG